MIRYLIIIILGNLLGGCAVMYTSYNPINNTGYIDEKVGKLYKVSYFGLSSTPSAKFAMNRCAELAAMNKKPFFKMYHTMMDAVENKVATQPLVMNFPKNNADVFVMLLDKKEEGAIEAIPFLKAANIDTSPYEKETKK